MSGYKKKSHYINVYKSFNQKNKKLDIYFKENGECQWDI